MNAFLQDRAIRHQVYFQRLTLGEIQAIVGHLNADVLPDLIARLEAMGPNPRLEQLRDAVREVLHGGFRELRTRLTDDLVDIGGAEAQWQTSVFRQAVPVEIDYVLPPPEVLRAIVTARPFEGNVLGDWWKGIEANAQAGIETQLKIGMTEGETIDGMVRRIRGTRENGFKDGIIQDTRRNVAAVVRTATNHVSNEVRQETYRANEDVVKGWQFVATLDARTTLICAAHDGKVYDVGDTEEAPPLHFGCRSTTAPVLKSFEELGIPGLKELDAGDRASMDGQVPANQTYEGWLRGQPKSVQDEVLGPGRGELFRAGGISLDRFIDEKNRPLTLTELRRLEEE